MPVVSVPESDGHLDYHSCFSHQRVELYRVLFLFYMEAAVDAECNSTSNGCNATIRLYKTIASRVALFAIRLPGAIQGVDHHL